MMKKLIVLCIIVLITAAPLMGSSPQETSLLLTLKPRQPNWRFEIVKSYSGGNPQIVNFYEPLAGDKEKLVKQVSFYPNNRIQTEADLIRVNEGTDAAIQWNSVYVPHGTRVEFTSDGGLAQVGHFEFGLLDGECQTFYPDGKVQSTALYRNGLLEGAAKLFWSNGQIKEDAFYERGMLVHDVVQYYENGTKAASLPYVEGKLEGIAIDWFPSGAVKMQRQFSEGMLHGDGKNPAMVIYDEEHNIREVLDFRKGKPFGMLTRYHSNGKEAFRVFFKNGEKEGYEYSFDENGTLIGSGEYHEGLPRGEHWMKHPNGQISYFAHFDTEGNCLEPTFEFNDQGQKIREYTLRSGQLEGAYFEWYDDGTLKAEYSYNGGKYEGEQKEYYPSGQIKVCSHYKNLVRDGVHEEWHENGILARRIHFLGGLKDGSAGEWFPNGISKIDSYFQLDSPDGVQSEWHENGQLKSRLEFEKGLKQGWQREWNEEGLLTAETRYDKDQIQGTALSWWNNGQIKTRFQFETGKKEGIHKWFYENGKPERIAVFKDDELEGEMLAWFQDGSMQSSQNFHHGKPIGEHRIYFPKSTPAQKDEERLSHVLRYDDESKLHGEEKTFYPNGKTHAVLTYEHGLLNGAKQVWDIEGVLVEEATYLKGKLEGRFFQKGQDGKEIVTHYHNNLKNGPHYIFYPPNEKGEKIKAISCTFENDQMEGLVVEYNPQGDKIAETNYVKGQKKGFARLYSNGIMTAKIELDNDKKNGLAIQYFPNGSIYREIHFIDDKKEGDENTYNEAGALISVFPYHNDKLEGLAKSWNPDGILVFEAEYQEGLRHGKFNKYYDDGTPLLEQTFAFDLLEGEKRKYERDGNKTISYYKAGEIVR